MALDEVANCLPRLDAVCVIDSALHSGMVSIGDLRSRATGRSAKLLARCSASAESGTESVFRVRALDAGFSVRSQVELPGSRVDFLFGERLIVEVDGSEHHAGPEAFRSDRERDAWHAALGYYVVRLTYAQVVSRWHEVESLLYLLHGRGEHLWPARMRNLEPTRRVRAGIDGVLRTGSSSMHTQAAIRVGR